MGQTVNKVIADLSITTAKLAAACLTKEKVAEIGRAHV